MIKFIIKLLLNIDKISVKTKMSPSLNLEFYGEKYNVAPLRDRNTGIPS